jgi:hypothetical protein
MAIVSALPDPVQARPPHAGPPAGVPGWQGGDDGADRERRRQELRRQLSEDRDRWAGQGSEALPMQPMQPMSPMPHHDARQRLSPDERRALREALRQDMPRQGMPRQGRERAPGQR